MKTLREWENSRDISEIYKSITKNKKVIREKAKDMLIKQASGIVINAQNLINILKDVLPIISLNNTQWKMIVNIADKDKSSMIDFELFLNLVFKSTKQFISHPKI